MPPRRVWLIVGIGTLSAAVAFAQHPATVFPGTPSLPGMSAPVAFPVNPDPGGLASPTPINATDSLQGPSDRQRQIERLTTEPGMDGLGTDQALKTQLLTMLDGDRRVTRVVGVHLARGEERPIGDIDRTNLVLLKAIVAQHGWPTIALVGATASRGASAILLHSADHAWQEQLRPDLERLVGAGKIVASDIAEIVDSLLVSSGKPQKFGTQFEARNDEVVILPVEDARHLDDRRADYFLPPVSLFRRRLESTYHLPVTGPGAEPGTH